MPEITNSMIRHEIDFEKNEYNHDMTYSEAKAQLESQRDRGCLLYSDCRSCPKFQKNCPM